MWWGMGYLHCFQVPPHKIHMNYKGRTWFYSVHNHLGTITWHNHLNQVTKVNISNGHIENTCLLTGCSESTASLPDIPPKDAWLESHWGHLRQIHAEGIPQGNWPVIFKSGKSQDRGAVLDCKEITEKKQVIAKANPNRILLSSRALLGQLDKLEWKPQEELAAMTTANFLILMAGYAGEYPGVQKTDMKTFGGDRTAGWQFTLRCSRKKSSFTVMQLFDDTVKTVWK